MTGRTAEFGAVAAGHPVTAQAALSILREGGNAFDAIVAALWTASVVEPVLASPGGGGFLMAHTPEKTDLVDFFVDTPKARRPADGLDYAEIHADFGTATQAFHIGRGASATPGFAPGLFHIAGTYGSLPMTRLVAPAVAAAREGVTMTPFQAYLFSVVTPILTWTEEARALFAPRGTLLGAGETFRNPDLADTIEETGRTRADMWTRGVMAERLLTGQREAGSLREGDLAGYRVETRTPLCARLGRYRVFLNPPPSLGGALIMAMNAKAGPRPVDLARAVDAIDTIWRQEPENAGRLVDMANAARNGGVASRGTTHVSVVDTFGNAAAATVSNGEGNGHIVPRSGFMLNNMLGEEDLNPRGHHAWKPGRRLGSMMAPTVTVGEDDGSLLALGSGGSNRIRTAILQVLVRRLGQGMALAEAIEHPRLHVERGHLDFEAGLGETETAALTAAFPDHRAWQERNLFFGGVHGVERDADGTIAGAGDSRREGTFLSA